MEFYTFRVLLLRLCFRQQEKEINAPKKESISIAAREKGDKVRLTRSHCVLRQTSLLVEMLIWLDTTPDLSCADAFKISLRWNFPSKLFPWVIARSPSKSWRENPGGLLKIVPTEETTSRPTPQLKTLFSGTGIGRKFSPTPCVSWSLQLLFPSSPAPWLPIDCLLPTPSSAAQSSTHPSISIVRWCCRWSIQSSPSA